MLDEPKIARTLEQLPRLTLAVVGDFFLDKYLEIDSRIAERSLETGIEAHQVVDIRTSPGAGGTVTNNLAALGAGRIIALTVIGSDGEGFDLKRELANRRVDTSHVLETADRRTPTYTKPMLGDGISSPRELNRLDIKNRMPMPDRLVRGISERLDAIIPLCDAVIVADQVSESDCGVITSQVRQRLAELAANDRDKIILADSRERIGLFRCVLTKPNRAECLAAVGFDRRESRDDIVQNAAAQLSERTGRPVFATLGESGILIADGIRSDRVRAFPVHGPVDIVGAGDSTTAGIVCGLATGLDRSDAAALGNLIASITIQQIGTTGTATPSQVLERWRMVQNS